MIDDRDKMIVLVNAFDKDRQGRNSILGNRIPSQYLEWKKQRKLAFLGKPVCQVADPPPTAFQYS